MQIRCVRICTFSAFGSTFSHLQDLASSWHLPDYLWHEVLLLALNISTVTKQETRCILFWNLLVLFIVSLFLNFSLCDIHRPPFFSYFKIGCHSVAKFCGLILILWSSCFSSPKCWDYRWSQDHNAQLLKILTFSKWLYLSVGARFLATISKRKHMTFCPDKKIINFVKVFISIFSSDYFEVT